MDIALISLGLKFKIKKEEPFWLQLGSQKLSVLPLSARRGKFARTIIKAQSAGCRIFACNYDLTTLYPYSSYPRIANGRTFALASLIRGLDYDFPSWRKEAITVAVADNFSALAARLLSQEAKRIYLLADDQFRWQQLQQQIYKESGLYTTICSEPPKNSIVISSDTTPRSTNAIWCNWPQAAVTANGEIIQAHFAEAALLASAAVIANQPLRLLRDLARRSGRYQLQPLFDRNT